MKKLLILMIAILSFASTDLVFKKSLQFEHRNDLTNAISILLSIYPQNTQDYLLNLRLAKLYDKKQNYQDALKYYYKASEILPNSIEAKLGLMKVYLNLALYNDVLRIGDKVLILNKYDYYGNLYILKALQMQRRYTAAQQVIKKMLSIYPTDLTYLLNLAKIYEQTNPQYAKRLYKDVILKIDDNNSAALTFLSR